MSLPDKFPFAGAAPDSLPEQTVPAKQAAAGRALRVLAVDDDALVLFNPTAMLEDLGHTVLEANSGAAALDLLRKHAVDLVITDQVMPKMTGMQLIDAVKEEWPELPVILATGFAELPGGSEVDIPKLAKPFTEADLAKALKLLDGQRRSPAGPEKRLRLI